MQEYKDARNAWRDGMKAKDAAQGKLFFILSIFIGAWVTLIYALTVAKDEKMKENGIKTFIV